MAVFFCLYGISPHGAFWAVWFMVLGETIPHATTSHCCITQVLRIANNTGTPYIAAHCTAIGFWCWAAAAPTSKKQKIWHFGGKRTSFSGVVMPRCTVTLGNENIFSLYGNGLGLF